MKKRINGAWVTKAPPKYGTAQDTITSLPAEVIADGVNATAWTIYGNMQQTGTPTPSSPIYPNECGDIVSSGEHSGEYLLPIECGGVTTNIYTAEPLRKIGNNADYKSNVMEYRSVKEYVYTGSETWNAGSENYYSFVPEVSGEGVPYSAVICSHCNGSTINNTGKAVFFKKSEFPNITTGAELKQYCADQYAASTPVTVWYVLATPTTTAVEAPEIPTTSGNQTFDVDTTLKPSKVEITYHGWHSHNPKQYEGSWEAQTRLLGLSTSSLSPDAAMLENPIDEDLLQTEDTE